MTYTNEDLERMKISLGLPLITLDEAVADVYKGMSAELHNYPTYPIKIDEKTFVDALRTQLDRVTKYRDTITDQDREKYNELYYKVRNPLRIVQILITKKDLEREKFLDEINDDDEFRAMLRERIGPGFSRAYKMEAEFLIELFKQYKAGGAIDAMLGHVKNSLDSKSY